jgi:hypothetical protein
MALPNKLRSKIVNVHNDLVTSDLRDGYLSANNATFEVLRDQIERAADRIVIAESPVAGRFGYELKWDASKPDSLTLALSREFGLTLKLDRRNIRTLVITTDHP